MAYVKNKPMESVFTDIYRKNGWESSESISGPGSTLAQTEFVRKELPILLQNIGAKSLLDSPCGDFNWMKEVELNVDFYIGADIVSDLVEENNKSYSNSVRRFVKLDLTKDELPRVDVILCRDCLFHLPNKYIFDALRNFKKSGSEYVLMTTFPLTENNIDIDAGQWRMLNLEAEPFNLIPPMQLLDEKCVGEDGVSLGKSLGLWKLNDIILNEEL